MCHGWLYSNGLCLNYVFLKKKIKISAKGATSVNPRFDWAPETGINVIQTR
jgi:hypothetical protein